jgi:hypothetical protein
MEQVLNFFQNKWTKFGFSFVSIGYVAFLSWLTWVTYAYYLKPTNEPALFTFYLLINFIFGIAVVYTRGQLITQISAAFLLPILLITLILNFGNWYLFIPPLLVSIAVFFICRMDESIKIVLGTLYFILYVVAVVAYIALFEFLGVSINDLDLSLRSDYTSYSPEGSYRLVIYVDDESKEKRSVSYYVEDATKDIHLPFLVCERVANSKRLLTVLYGREVPVKWISDDKLMLDNRLKEINLYVDEDAEITWGTTTVTTTKEKPAESTTPTEE